MRKYFAGQSYSDALRPLCKQQRELDRQCDRLLVTTVIRSLPLSCLGIEQGFKSELGQTGLNVSGCGGAVASKDVSLVSLTLY